MNERFSIGNSLNGKDYFNYYFSGVVWIVDFFLLISSRTSTGHLLGLIQKIPTVISIILVVAIPYVVGFVLSPCGNCVTKWIREIFDDPVDWVLVLGDEPAWDNKHKGKRLAGVWRKSLYDKIKELVGKDIKYSPFFWVRTYVETFSPDNGRKLADRALILANLTESLILPSSLLSFLILEQIGLPCIVSFLISVLIFSLLCYRYLQLREYWAKHVYRVFYFTQHQK